jgi:hypothetical protein
MEHKDFTTAEPLYEVVWPLGKSASGPATLAPALGELELGGKTVCEFWGWVYRGDQMFPIINEELKEKYNGITIIDHNRTGDSHGNNITEKSYLAGFPNILSDHHADAVICGVGA